jgi:hypothetical protein
MKSDSRIRRHIKQGRKLDGKHGRKNPALFLTDKQRGKIAGDLAIQNMFGLFGTALAASSPKLREAMLKVSAIEIDPTPEPGDPPL